MEFILKCIKSYKTDKDGILFKKDNLYPLIIESNTQAKVMYKKDGGSYFMQNSLDEYFKNNEQKKMFAITTEDGYNEFFWDENKAKEKIENLYKKNFPGELFWTEEVPVN